VKNADDRKQVPVRKSVLVSPSSRPCGIASSTRPRTALQFDNEKLIARCIQALNDAPPDRKTRLQWKKAGLAIGKAGVEAKELAVSEPVHCTRTTLNCPTC
jgi:type III restriction enzyme